MLMEDLALLAEERLWPEATLSYLDLLAPDERWGDNHGPTIRESGGHVGRPMVYPLPAGDLPPALRSRAAAGRHRYYGLLLAFDLDDLPHGRRYASADFSVDLDDDRVVAAAVHLDGDALGLVIGDDGFGPASGPAQWLVGAEPGDRERLLARLLSRAPEPRPQVRGLLRSDFGWTFQAAGNGAPLRHVFSMHAILEAPPDVRHLAGLLTANAAV